MWLPGRDRSFPGAWAGHTPTYLWSAPCRRASRLIVVVYIGPDPGMPGPDRASLIVPQTKEAET